ncbi:uncharacterized protein LOC114311106 [Camellia sinensis]|uniref:uncharacterized protein LOC114311106 n=1 Tax=Camellia sinensis TaxID=4442 RepID=UPI00103673B1|nr:uncharacterized protein LOC114311106 [Camellia sinensis]
MDQEPTEQMTEVEDHQNQTSAVALLLGPETEVAHLVAFAWWIEQIRMTIVLSWEGLNPQPVHSIQMASMRSEVDDRRRIRSIVKDLVSDSPLTYPSMDLLCLLFWNCQGAGNNNFKRNLNDIIRTHKPEILVLLETKVPFSKMGNFFNRLGFTASTIVDPVGRVEGIWIVWDTSQVTVRASSATSQAIHATIHKADYDEWVLAAVYASPSPVMRDQLWDNLEDVAGTMGKPWLVAGDFNDFATQGERRSFTSRNSTVRNQKFLDRVNNCNLMDLGSSGPSMTWTNNRKGLANTMERLDRAMCNSEWRTMFPEATVRILPRTYSDHSPLLVYTQGTLKLNTDGCSKGDPGQAGYGGLLRDDTGIWIWGYYGNLGHCTCLEAEIWAIYRGLTILFQKGLTNVVIETDSEQAMLQIQQGPNPNSPLKALIEDAKFLLQRCHCSILHTLREGNKVVDILADLGVAQAEHVKILEDPPIEVTTLLIEDMTGVAGMRE